MIGYYPLFSHSKCKHLNFFSNFFNKEQEDKINIPFGRTFENLKSREQLSLWDLAISSYDSDQFLESIQHFLDYMKAVNMDLVQISKSENKLEAQLVQGSRLVELCVDETYFRARVDIAEIKEDNIGLMRRLLESSYKLIYGRYCIQKNGILSIVFDGYIQEAAPNKLYEGLKEIALRADKEDDILLDDFTVLERLNTKYNIEIPDHEKEIKFGFIKKCLDDLSNKENHVVIDLNKFTGAHIYLILSTLYKIDYLILPQGRLMDKIEFAHKKYFDRNEIDLGNKTFQLLKSIRDINAINKSDLYKELYRVNHVFPISNLINTSDLANSIEVEFNAMNWYYDNRYFEICEAICDYIVGSNFFSHTIPSLSHKLMHYYYELREPQFFKELGIDTGFAIDQTKNNAEVLKKKVLQLLIDNFENHKIYEANLQLNDQSNVDLLVSYLRFIQNFHY
ncbi:MAG: hypothetical protein IT267_11075 [Saprospiraceae bacterium]|nr:hypothetical protein [Saprospiraceae bacterium]